MMPWCDDLSTCSLDQVIQSQAENRAWGSELRRKSSGLVNSRLAREITMEQYAAVREVARADAAECERRGTKLSDEIHGRSGIRLRMGTTRGTNRPEMTPSAETA